MDGGLATVLLSADFFDLIVPLKVRTARKCIPPCRSYSSRMDAAAHLTGPTKGTKQVLKVYVSTPDEDLHRQVQEWWKTESFECKCDRKSSRSVEDEIALKILESTTKKLGDRHKTGLL